MSFLSKFEHFGIIRFFLNYAPHISVKMTYVTLTPIDHIISKIFQSHSLYV